MPKINYQKLIQSVSIDEVAKQLGMDLRKETATTSKTLCPFHDDTKPSLLIDSSRDRGLQHFHCYACGAHGDVIDLVKDRLKLDFKAAVEWLAPGEFNLAKSKRPVNSTTASITNSDHYAGLKLGYQIYRDGYDTGKFEDWARERQLDAVVLQRAGFLYAANNFLSRKIASEKDASQRRERFGLLEDTHLVRKLFPGVKSTHHLPFSEVNQYSDFFIGDRIVFPLYDEKKKLVGLGGRSVEGEGTASSVSPKYQFTRGFPKATVLYRAEQAFKQVRSEAKQGNKNINLYLCEGFLDALRFESLGLPAVAIMGSSITEQQARLLQVLSDGLPKDAILTVVISFDRDEAGLRGAAHACLKLMHSAVECRFLWPQTSQLTDIGIQPDKVKDPNDYLQKLQYEAAVGLITSVSYQSELAVLADEFGVSAEDTLNDSVWSAAPRSRKFRAFTRAFNRLKKVAGKDAAALLKNSATIKDSSPVPSALAEWIDFTDKSEQETHRSLSEEFLNDVKARLNHSRILAYMGSKRGELPCDEPRWERLDIAATAFNALLADRLNSPVSSGPIASYDAVWVPRVFGGSEYRLKMMPCPEDLIIQQYLLNEILSERWDHKALTDSPFSRMIPAVRYYREERRTITTGFDSKGDGCWGELPRTLSFAYQIDMDVLEGRQPASDQGMYRPFHDCWRDFMRSLAKQAKEIGYVYSIRLDVKRYYDRLRQYVVRDRLQARLQAALESVEDDTFGFAELLHFDGSHPSAAIKTTTTLDRLAEYLFGVCYKRPDTGLDDETDALMGIPQGPVLSAWIGSAALFPVDEEAYRFMNRLNTDRVRVGYARYVDDIVLLADSPTILEEMREAMDRCTRKLELTLLAKADEIPAMSAEDFSDYINQGRALAASGPAWEPPLVGDGESGWDFWSVTPTTDRQSALQLLHNVELYKASKLTLLQTVKTAFQAPDLRTSELSKAARLIWYSIACEQCEIANPNRADTVWTMYLDAWNSCMQGSAWRLEPENNVWESPMLFALEGLEHLLDKESRDLALLSAQENITRRKRITWLAKLVLTDEFDSDVFSAKPGPRYQLETRLRLVRWKAVRVAGQKMSSGTRQYIERSEPVQNWRPFEWMHEAISLLSDADQSDEDPLIPFGGPTVDQTRRGVMSGFAADVFKALLPDVEEQGETQSSEVESRPNSNVNRIALQTLVSIVPREKLLACLSRRQRLIREDTSTTAPNRLPLPPLPGLTTHRLFSCLGEKADEQGLVTARGIEAIGFTSAGETLALPTFLGSDGISQTLILSPSWHESSILVTDCRLQRANTDLETRDVLRLRERIHAMDKNVSANDLKLAATLFRALAQVVTSYAKINDGQELVPAWPYIAASENGSVYYLIVDGVSRAELGNRAFVRDGGRMLRTVEVPIYEASLWRVGVAISDYLGLHDDVVKFNSAELDVDLNTAALANPARYVLRTQLRKLRGAYADSKIGKKYNDDCLLPATVERTLRLLETFPADTEEPLDQLVHVLAAEAESAGMYLAFRESWNCTDSTFFLKALTGRVLARLPLSIAEALAASDEKAKGLRRDFAGLLCFARRLFTVEVAEHVTALSAWEALRAGIVCTGISVAIDGLLASMRSHGAFEHYDHFDFPTDWGIQEAAPQAEEQYILAADSADTINRSLVRVTLIEQLRRLIRHLGHRLYPNSNSQDRLSDQLVEELRLLAQTVATVEFDDDGADSLLDWPFAMLSKQRLDLLNLELLEAVAMIVKQIDKEIGFEIVLVTESTYGYNAQKRRFTDSRNSVREVTSWMISQFPANSKHIEEISNDGRFLRVWSEVFDRKTSKLLSVSALGEPFASIAITKPKLDASVSPNSELGQPRDNETVTIAQAADLTDYCITDQDSSQGNSSRSQSEMLAEGHAHQDENAQPSHLKEQDVPASKDSKESENLAPTAISKKAANLDTTAFRKQQIEQWSRRGENCRKDGHVRVALLQADFDLTYTHPFVEVCPTNWPFNPKVKETVSKHLKSDPKWKGIYGPLLSAAESPNTAHLWVGLDDDNDKLPSWSEHRRRAILRRVIDSCQAFGVDLLVLPEYSVRSDTIDWLKTYLANKTLSVLAGTYMNVQKNADSNHLTAPLKLLWPLPKEVAHQFIASLVKNGQGSDKNYDTFLRGHVLEFSRNKKYRSIALEEFLRPSSDKLGPLFKPDELIKKLEEQIGFEPSANVISHLLANTRLPLKHLLELICSEIFLVSSPANYNHMADDLKEMRRRFGMPTNSSEVFADIESLSDQLSITSNGIRARRSILAVPAATSRSADYWIVGQASFLAAGTATVFCNGIDGKTLVGGSCFIGRGSWTSEEKAIGYISKITPYHGWSKGIYYNDKNDALSKHDQAVVIADIDPYNMLEGKPRAQTMPSPLQLVAYLPLVESVDWSLTQANLLKMLAVPEFSQNDRSMEIVKPRIYEEGNFWNAVQAVRTQFDEQHLSYLWSKFSDADALSLRAKAYAHNGHMQPTTQGYAYQFFSIPALYDWIDVSLTLHEHEDLPTIVVPPWRGENT